MDVTSEDKLVYLYRPLTGEGVSVGLMDSVHKGTFQTDHYDYNSNYGGGIHMETGKEGLFGIGNSVYNYSLANGITEKIFSWTDSSLSSSNILFFTVLSNQTILAVLSDHSSGQIAYLTKTAEGEKPSKEILTLGLLYSYPNITNEAVANFNMNNEKYQIEIVNYGTSDQVTGLRKLNLDIIFGKCPDIIDMEVMDLEHLAAMGLLEDLNQYLDADTYLQKEDLRQSVLQAYTVDEKLCCIPPVFCVETVFAKTSDVGAAGSISMEELSALAHTKSNLKELFCNEDAQNVLISCLRQNLNEYLDWGRGKCNFESPSFINLLELAREYGGTENIERSTSEKLRSETALLYKDCLQSFQQYQLIPAYFGEPVTMIGYPSKQNGNGSYMKGLQGFYAIYSGSSNKEGAWEFIRSFLTPEFYESYPLVGYPTLNSAYDQYAQEEMTGTYIIEEDGSKTETPLFEFPNGDSAIPIYAATQEQVDLITNLIDSTTTTSTFNYDLENIILEEAAPFFEGQKDAKEVAGIILSRVQLFVNENR